jgi:acyl-coenzyme A synthetase/AMP-(fatty) acid ligase
MTERSSVASVSKRRNVTFGPLPKTSTAKVQKLELRERVRNQISFNFKHSS